MASLNLNIATRCFGASSKGALDNLSEKPGSQVVQAERDPRLWDNSTALGTKVVTALG
jgi:hypothetical protein